MNPALPTAKRRLRLPASAWALAGLALLFPAIASGTTRTVAIDGTAEFTSVQEAILASVHGDTVLVSPGRYPERLFYGGRRIVVRSSHGPERTIIDAEGTGTVVTFLVAEPASAILEGFTLTGGSGTFLALREPEPTASGGLKYGGAILCLPGHPTLRNLRIVGNTANTGGGIYGEGSVPRLEDCVFENNDAGTGGGGAFDDSAPVFLRCSFAGASTANGGGLSLSDCSARIEDCLFRGNLAGRGGAIRCFSPTGGPPEFVNRVERSIFIGNVAGRGSAIFNEFGTIEVRQNLFFRNGQADIDLDTIYMRGGNDIVFTQNAFVENLASTPFFCDSPPATPVTIGCNNFYPAPVPETECLDQPTNFTRHPLFCNWRNPEASQFQLREDSPLLPKNSPNDCGQVGPFGEAGCPVPFADILSELENQGALPPVGSGESEIN